EQLALVGERHAPEVLLEHDPVLVLDRRDRSEMDRIARGRPCRLERERERAIEVVERGEARHPPAALEREDAHDPALVDRGGLAEGESRSPRPPLPRIRVTTQMNDPENENPRNGARVALFKRWSPSTAAAPPPPAACAPRARPGMRRPRSRARTPP